MPRHNGINWINGKPFTALTNLNVIGEFRTNGTLLGEALIDSSSTAATQSPSAVDSPIQVEFGEAKENDLLSLSSDGALTIKVSAYYQIVINVIFGRDSNPGAAILFGRLLVNGQQPEFSPSIGAIIGDINLKIPKQIIATIPLQENDVVTFEIARDSGGNNSGGLFKIAPTTLDWNDAPTASIEVFNVE